MRNFQEPVEKAFCYQILFWPFNVWMNCSSDLKNFATSCPSASNFKIFSLSLEQFFLTVGQNNFGNKIPLIFFSQQNMRKIYRRIGEWNYFALSWYVFHCSLIQNLAVVLPSSSRLFLLATCINLFFSERLRPPS